MADLAREHGVLLFAQATHPDGSINSRTRLKASRPLGDFSDHDPDRIRGGAIRHASQESATSVFADLILPIQTTETGVNAKLTALVSAEAQARS
jgi:hypothetical protein